MLDLPGHHGVVKGCPRAFAAPASPGRARSAAARWSEMPRDEAARRESRSRRSRVLGRGEEQTSLPADQGRALRTASTRRPGRRRPPRFFSPGLACPCRRTPSTAQPPRPAVRPPGAARPLETFSGEVAPAPHRARRLPPRSEPRFGYVPSGPARSAPSAGERAIQLSRSQPPRRGVAPATSPPGRPVRR